MTGHVKVAGAWKDVDTISTKVNGAWKEVAEGYTKVAGVWQQFYSSGPTLRQNNYSILLNSTNSNGYVDIPSTPIIENLTELTVEAWVRRLGPGTSGYPVIVCQSGLTGGDYQVAFDNNRDTLFFRHEFVNSQGQWAVQMPPDNTWFHVAVTFNVSESSVPTFYINGIEYTNGFNVDQVPSGEPLYSNGPLTIGSRDFGIRDLYGHVDEVRIWNKIRTAEEINEYYNKYLSSASGLVGCWSFEEGTGTAVPDLTGNSDGQFIEDVQFSSEIPPETPVPLTFYSDYQLLETVELTSNVSTISFTGLNAAYGATYSDLQLRINANEDGDNGKRFLKLRFNNDLTSAHESYSMSVNLDAPAGAQFVSQNEIHIGAVRGNSASPIYTSSIVDIYDPFMANKSTLFTAISGGSEYSANYDGVNYSGGYYAKEEAINEITIGTRDNLAGNLTAGTKVSLYGYRK